jgi:hypothetical protein
MLVGMTARHLADQNKNRLTAEVSDHLGSLTVDPMRLRQILFNLLSFRAKIGESIRTLPWNCLFAAPA